MGIGDWLRRRAARQPQGRPQQPAPPTVRVRASSVVEFDDQSVTCRRPGGLVETVRWDDLRAVLLVTTSDGPNTDDVFWMLAGDGSGCVVPSEAEHSDKLLERLQRLPGFDHAVVIEAMSCTDDREFLCWRRPGY